MEVNVAGSPNYWERNGIIDDDDDEMDMMDAVDDERHATDDVKDFMSSMENERTKKKTRLDLKTIQDFFATRGEMRKIEDIEPSRLDQLLCDFFINVRKRDGGQYEPVSLRCFLSSLERHLTSKNYEFSVTKHHHFKKCREALRKKQTHLKKLGHGNRPNRTRPLTDAEVDLMFAKKVFSLDTPQSLANLMWWNCCYYFGIRTGTECRNMKWGDVELLKDQDGAEYVQFTERQTKTRTGESVESRTIPPRMFATTGLDDDPRDPVSAYKKYRDVRPCGMNGPDTPFFLGVRHTVNNHGSWFLQQPMGESTLGAILKKACDKGTHYKIYI